MGDKDKTEVLHHLALWNTAQMTDPRYTKKFDRGGFKGTAINATYIAKRLTETFGPCGIGWRMVVERERIIAGPNNEMLHTIRGHLDYSNDGGKTWHSTGPQFGQTKMVLFSRGDKPDGSASRHIFDEEAPKKSITDCMTKCASLLGFAADVHLGLYDDNKYVNEVTAKFGTDKKTTPGAAPAPAATSEKKLLSNEEVQKLVDTMADAGLSSKSLCKFYDIKAITDLPADKLNDALAEIAKYKAKKAAKAATGGAP